MIAVLLLSLRSLARGRRLLVIAVLLALPPLLAVAYAAGEPHANGMNFAVLLFENLVLPVLMPLTTALIASSALGNEIEDRTLVYLTLRPISRLALITGKLVAASAVCIVLIELSVGAVLVITSQATADMPSAEDPGNVLLALLTAAALGTCAYAALFMLLGLLAPRRGLLVAFIYSLAWEGLAAGLSGALAALSVRGYVQGVLDAVLDTPRLSGLQGGSQDGLVSVLVLGAITVGAAVATTIRLRSLELP